MLIDIEKYVRQLLPPNRRQPVHVALATLLFRPIEAVIRAFNDYAFDTQFDTGTPGQVGVLQVILQVYVDPNARVIDGDGVRFDFVVLVAQPSLHKRARQLVERYKMTGKRYDVTTAVSWGGSSISFSFQMGFPRVDATGQPGQWVVGVAVNEPGLHPTVITNTATGKVWVNQPLQFGSGSLNFSVYEPGQYRVQVRGVVGFATAVAGGGTNSGGYAGMFVIERAGRRYTYTDTPDLRLGVASDGKVQLLVGPATKLSANGQKTCNPYVLVNERVPREAFREALLGASGAVFATGKSYAIAITWMPTDVFSSYADLANQQKMEATSRAEDNKYLNTAGQDYIYLTIENL